MSKPKTSDQPKALETRTPSDEHLRAVAAADAASTQAFAVVGRGYLELLGLTQRAQGAEAALNQARLKAAISVGIDPDGQVPWAWDSARGMFIKS